jgi:hypothetical protein
MLWLLSFPYLITVMHLSECGKEKLKNGTSSAKAVIRNTLVIATRLQLRAKRGRGVADAAIQNTLVIARRRSRRGNPGRKPLDCFTSFAMTAMHHCLPGLLHFVRNDGILDSIATSKYHCHCKTAYLGHCETAQPARQSRIPSSLQQGFSCERSAAEAQPTRQSRIQNHWIASLRSQ